MITIIIYFFIIITIIVYEMIKLKSLYKRQYDESIIIMCIRGMSAFINYYTCKILIKELVKSNESLISRSSVIIRF